MNALLSTQSIKIFHKLLVCCSNIGDSLLFEIIDDALILRTFDSTKCAFVVFYLGTQFFEHFQVKNEKQKKNVKVGKKKKDTYPNTLNLQSGAKVNVNIDKQISTTYPRNSGNIGINSETETETETENETETETETETDIENDYSENVIFQINLKSLIAIFKKSHSYERVSFETFVAGNILEITIGLRLQMKKIISLPFLECDLVNAIYSHEAFPNQTVCRSKLLINALNKFQSNTGEITFEFTKQSFNIKSHEVDEKPSIRNKKLQTEIVVKLSSLELYLLNENFVNCELTFVLKEFRAILNFCDYVHQPVNIFFDFEGKPILVSIKIPNELRMDFIMSTFDNLNLSNFDEQNILPNFPQLSSLTSCEDSDSTVRYQSSQTNSNTLQNSPKTHNN
ncbi:DNA repair protein rad9 [Anaeramoeba flamelloides]|uniref:DNA repair protein rad9 n=1 Tax=Anaeramoeba flamelloides TaxID=1746091 RepID=A0ABQ8XAT1_9EUKA|nr:DNA repair protein rad9 [Anaeramoeba flamelloides]